MRQIALLVVLLILTTALSACDSGTGPATSATVPVATATTGPGVPAQPSISPETAATSATAEHVTITFAIFEYERAAFEPLIAAFENENPDIHVQLVMLDPLFERGEPPEYERVVLGAADTTDFPMSDAAIANGWVRDLTPLLEADASFDRSDFYPRVLEASRQGDGFYMVPRSLRLPGVSQSPGIDAIAGVALQRADYGAGAKVGRRAQRLLAKAARGACGGVPGDTGRPQCAAADWRQDDPDLV
jgi:ABC-type glycerol-3-phosphate transport system substrate-binding protein